MSSTTKALNYSSGPVTDWEEGLTLKHTQEQIKDKGTKTFQYVKVVILKYTTSYIHIYHVKCM